MKHVVFVGTCVIAVLVSSCTLPDPVRWGMDCEGITADDIQWGAQEDCRIAEKEGDEGACLSEAELYIQTGRCPYKYACQSIGGVNQCVPKCQNENEVLCEGECINPSKDRQYCGARGTCMGGNPENEDGYRGEDCSAKDEEEVWACKNSRCEKTPCNPGEHLKEKEGSEAICVKDNNYACGSEDKSCKEDEVCNLGVCEQVCQDQERIICHVPGAGNQCIDPQTNPKFCGARGKCNAEDRENEHYKGEDCRTGDCVRGSCRLLECTDENEMLCGTQCIDVTKNSDNCGGCGNNCANNLPRNVTADVTCQERQCVYTCASGYQDCGSHGRNCVNLMQDAENCGSCGNVCDPAQQEYCFNGICQKNDCPGEYECSKSEQCLTNEPTGCGRSCQVCGSVLNAQESTCDDVGMCHVVKCLPGSHFVSGTAACVLNTPIACGSVDKADAVDCTALPNVLDVQCMNGECWVRNCKEGYHLHENACEVNSDDNCGSHGHKCQVPNGTSHCQNGACVTTGCDAGFHQEANYCTGDNLNNCGGKDCTTEPGWLSGLCEDASCKATGCQPGFYLDGSTCKANNQNNCGTKGKKCTVSNGTATCNTSTGTCSTTGCNMWYELVDGACVSTLVVGAEVEFGRYPQDENSDMPSPLTWQVLDVTKDSALLISKYVLERYPYHDKKENITWEQSNVRSYLNGFDGTHNQNGIDHTGKGFIDMAFTADEQRWIKQVTNTNPSSPVSWNNVPGGNNTTDKVFLLSHGEVLQYFPTNKSRVAHPTAYAIHPPTSSGRNNLYTCQVTCSGDNSCSASGCNSNGTNVQACLNVQCGSAWWLRSPAYRPDYAANVHVDGGVSFGGVFSDIVGTVNHALRPALYVHLNL